MQIDEKRVKRLARAVLREKCRRSFYFFFKHFWNINNKEKLVDSPHIKLLCDEAETVVRRIIARQPKLYDLIINVPPGTSKSNIFSQSLEAWAWAIDPTLQFITASHSMSLALALSVKSKDILLSEEYKRLFPEVRIRFDLKGKQWFSNTAGGYRYSCTPLISPIGRHAHLIVVDDPLNPGAAVSDAERNTVNDWFESTLPTRVVDKEISAMILVMQRLHEEDPTGFLLSHEGQNIRHICLPGKIDSVLRPKPESYSAIYEDNLLDPVRLSQPVLDSLWVRMGAYNYAGQIEQSPTPRSGGLFSPEKLKVTSVLPQKLVRVVRSWDKAGTEGGGCNTAGVKMGLLENGEIIVLDSVFGQWRAEKREQVILQNAKLDGKDVRVVIEQEAGSGGKESAEATVRNLRGFSVIVDRPKGDKSTRAEPFATQVNIGNVYLLEGPWNKAYIDELGVFPRGRFKDQVDASSQAFNALVNSSRIDYRRMMAPDDASKPKMVNNILLP